MATPIRRQNSRYAGHAELHAVVRITKHVLA
jgi:hypothetical protein